MNPLLLGAVVQIAAPIATGILGGFLVHLAHKAAGLFHSQQAQAQVAAVGQIATNAAAAAATAATNAAVARLAAGGSAQDAGRAAAGAAAASAVQMLPTVAPAPMGPAN